MFKILVLLLFFIVSNLQSQEIKIKGNFLEDSTEIGNIISFNLDISYPKDLEIILPDSNYNYKPFEFVDKSFVPTISDSIYNYDSITYKLTSYNLEKTQFIQLPIFILNSKDSTIIYSNIDSIRFKEFITQLSDTLLTKSNTNLSLINLDFNYPLLSYVILIILITSIVIYIIFRKKIIIYFKIRYQDKEYKNYINKMNHLYKNINKRFNRKKIELMLLTWKRYNEKISDYPYSSLATNEIITLGIAKDVNKILESIDKTIYAKVDLNNFEENFIKLKNHSFELYNKKLIEIKNE